MSNVKNLIFIELNELNFKYAKKYIEKYNLKNLKKLCDQNFTNTIAKESYEYLEPWIQWTSVHSGLSAKEHKVFRLGDIVNTNIKDIFSIIEEKGFKVGAIMPMNTKNNLSSPAYFIPDAWTKTSTDKSVWSKILNKCLTQIILDNSKQKVTLKSFFYLFICFLKFFSISNLSLYLKYFFKGNFNKYYLVLFLDLFLHDIHLKLLKKHNTNFSTLFLNGIAHIQHHYLFNSKLIENNIKNPEWYLSKKEDPFFEIIKLYDKIIGDYLHKTDYNLLVATGLSQVKYDRIKFYYRLRNHENFLKKIGINYKKVFPRMTRDFLIEFNNESLAFDAEKLLKKVTIDKKENLFGIIENRGKSLFVTSTYPNELTNANNIYLDDDIILKGLENLTFVAIKNGMHSEEGYMFNNFEKKSENIEIKEIFFFLKKYFKI